MPSPAASAKVHATSTWRDMMKAPPGTPAIATIERARRENRLENLGLIERAGDGWKLTAIGEMWDATKP